MVQPRWKGRSVLRHLRASRASPLYGLFFLYPFGQGIRISFTNWDGLTPRIPISLPKPEFESKILDKLSRADRPRNYLLSVLLPDPADNQYKRLYAATGRAPLPAQRLMRIAGYQPEMYRTVGFANYINLHGRGGGKASIPTCSRKINYNADSDLPGNIPTGTSKPASLRSCRTLQTSELRPRVLLRPAPTATT